MSGTCQGRILGLLVTYDYWYIGSSIRHRRLSIFGRSGLASNELCSILWTSSSVISPEWRRETANQ
jgi:hypothetical protein